MNEKGELSTNTLVGYVSEGSLDMNYETLKNKPSINGVELDGNKTSKELGIESLNGLPSGGKTGQVLVKSSNEDFASEWKEIDTEETDPTVPEYVKKITEGDIVSWNNKSDFSGSYDDLTGKPSIPTKLSDLTNDEGFIKNTVNNLENYYLKQDVYTKEEVNTIIGNLHSVSISVVETLPDVGESNIIYFVPKTGSENDVYDEYVYINNSWEHIGSTQVDLTDYYNKNQINGLFSDLENNINNDIGNLSDLNTQNKSNLVSSINEINSSIGDISTILSTLTTVSEVSE